MQTSETHTVICKEEDFVDYAVKTNYHWQTCTCSCWGFSLCDQGCDWYQVQIHHLLKCHSSVNQHNECKFTQINSTQ